MDLKGDRLGGMLLDAGGSKYKPVAGSCKHGEESSGSGTTLSIPSDGNYGSCVPFLPKFPVPIINA
jgi:hypothetical protein